MIRLRTLFDCVIRIVDPWRLRCLLVTLTRNMMTVLFYISIIPLSLEPHNSGEHFFLQAPSLQWLSAFLSLTNTSPNFEWFIVWKKDKTCCIFIACFVGFSGNIFIPFSVGLFFVVVIKRFHYFLYAVICAFFYVGLWLHGKMYVLVI